MQTITHDDVRERAAALASRFADRHREVRQHPFAHDAVHPELWEAYCEAGFPALVFGEGGLSAAAAVMEELAAANLLLWMPVLTAAIGTAIAQCGPDGARD